MDLNIVITQIDVGLVLAIIIVLEMIKQILTKVAKIKVPTWVWKVAVIVLGIGASFLSRDGSIIRGIFLYAAGSTIIYQTVKTIVTPMMNRFIEVGGEYGKGNRDNSKGR